MGTKRFQHKKLYGKKMINRESKNIFKVENVGDVEKQCQDTGVHIGLIKSHNIEIHR